MKTILQTVCVVIVAVGIAIEVYYKADLGFLCITAGSLALAISTKIERRMKK